jgi:A/G-specific adenine glycosylase
MLNERMKNFRKTVWKYYRTHKRDFPWRDIHNPYAIYVSEIMLQQTQVSRVVEKFPEFLKIFPTAECLAKAPLSRVLKSWQGMGYNRRAINLKRAAEMIVKEFDGEVPHDPDELVTLPGVGVATAGSIAAFAYNAPVVFIETNIRRVFIHHFFPRRKNVSDEELMPIVAAALPRGHAREWYSALMDYGTYLVKTTENSNKRSNRYRVQPKFEGSNRQLRGKMLKVFLMKQKMTEAMFVRKLSAPRAIVQLVLHDFVREGFVQKEKNYFVLVS